MSQDKIIRVGLVQMNCISSQRSNLEHAVEKITQAARDGATLVCLPELFRSQYFCQKEDTSFFDLAEPIPGHLTQVLGQVAKQHSVVIIVPIFERRTAGIYHNSIVVLDSDGSIAGLYRKMHIPDDPAYYEKYYFILYKVSRCGKYHHVWTSSSRTPGVF